MAAVHTDSSHSWNMLPMVGYIVQVGVAAVHIPGRYAELSCVWKIKETKVNSLPIIDITNGLWHVLFLRRWGTLFRGRIEVLG